MAGKHDERIEEAKEAFGEGRSRPGEKLQRDDISDAAVDIDAERVDPLDIGRPEHRETIREGEEKKR